MIANKVVYFHIHPLLNEIFYVGMGSEKRALDKTSRNRYWLLEARRFGFIVNIIDSGLTTEQAKELEKKYIKKLGRRDLGTGSLVNLSEGGEGKRGRKESVESKQKKSVYWTNFYKTNESHNLGKTHTKEINLKKGKSLENNTTARRIIYKGVEYGCVKSLWAQHFKGVMSYSNFVFATRRNKINLN